ncbi:hypothetical protein [Mycolicibacterium phlei]
MTTTTDLAALVVRETPCEMMRRIAEETREEIRRLSGVATNLNNAITALEALPEPDQTKIKALRDQLTSVEAQLEQNRSALKNIEIDISMFC